MLVLDSTTKSIVATMSGTANTTNPSFVTAYSDNTGTVFTEGSSDGALNGISSVTLVAAPASSTRRLIKTIYISNIDTAAVTVTISYNDNSTLRQIAKVTLQVGDTWSTDGTTDNTGSLKTTAGSVNLSNVTGTLTANGIVYASSTSVLTTGSALVFNGTNLGIGTSSPAYKLDVSTSSADAIQVSKAASDGYFVQYKESSTLVGYIYSSTGTSNPFRIGAGAPKPLSLETNGVSRVLIDSAGNLGLGQPPNAWSGIKVLQVGSYGGFYNLSTAVGVSNNFYYDGTNARYINTSAASYYSQSGNTHGWYQAASGTAGAVASFTQAMTLSASGNLLVNTTSENYTASIITANPITTTWSGTIGLRYNVSGQTTNYYKGMTGTSIQSAAARGLHIFNYDADSNPGILFYPASYQGQTADPAVVIAPTGSVDIVAAGATLSLNRGSYSQQTKFYQDTGGAGAIYETTNPSVNAQYYAHVFKGTNNVPTTLTFATINQYGIGLGNNFASSGTGIAFPATQNASSNVNTLDDYEEGTWTTTFNSPSNLSGTPTLSAATYTKIGNVVQLSGRITGYSVITANSPAYAVPNVPFSMLTNSSPLAGGVYGYLGGVYVSGVCVDNTSGEATSFATVMPAIAVTATGAVTIDFSITYQAA